MSNNKSGRSALGTSFCFTIYIGLMILFHYLKIDIGFDVMTFLAAAGGAVIILFGICFIFDGEL